MIALHHVKAESRRCCAGVPVLHGGLGDILHAEQRVGTVWTAQDTWGKNYGQRVRRHAVVRLHFTHPEKAFAGYQLAVVFAQAVYRILVVNLTAESVSIFGTKTVTEKAGMSDCVPDEVEDESL